MAKEVKHKWCYEDWDYICDIIDGDADVRYWHLSKDVSECIWLPRYDQLEELYIEFFIYNMGMSNFEAHLRLVEWYSGCQREAFEQSLKNSDYGFIDSSEELLLNEEMT